MAEKGASSIATQKLEDQLTCPVCLDQFTDPRTLPCLHSFCAKCLQKLPLETDKGGDGHFLTCPTCRTKAELPQQGMTGFHKAFHLKSIEEVHHLMKKVHVSGGEEKVCDKCKKEDSTGYCSECEQFLCNSCDDVHRKWGPTLSHKLMSLSEIFKVIQTFSVKPDLLASCSSHKKPLELYCVTCEEPICNHCSVKNHKGHNHDLITDVYEESKGEIQSSLEQLEEKIGEVNDVKENVLAGQENIQLKVSKWKNAVNQVCNEFVQEIEKARIYGLWSASLAIQNKRIFEDQEINAIEKPFSDCQEDVESTMRQATPTQLLMEKKQIMLKLDNLLEIHLPEFDSIEPTEFEDEEDVKNQRVCSKIRHAVNDLQKVFTFKYSYPEKVYEQCQFVPLVFPMVIHSNEKSIATFKILFQGEMILIDEEDVHCSFHTEEFDDFPSQSDFFSLLDIIVKDEEIQYQLSFTIYESGNHFFELSVGHGIEIDTKQTSIQVNYLDSDPDSSGSGF